MRARRNWECAGLLAALVLAGCGGPSRVAAVPAPASSPATHTQSVTFVVQLPSRTSSGRGTRYVSPSTQIIKAAVTPSAGGSTTTAQNACTNGQCSVTIAAPVGTDTFTIGLYDGQNNVLSTGTTSQTIVEGQSNTVTVVFGGVIASVRLNPATTFFARGTPASTTIAVNALDADGNVIVGPPANYSSPIAVSTNDTTGSTTLSASTVTQPGTVLTLTYNGSASVPASVTVTGTAAGAAAGTSTLTFAVASFLYENAARLQRYAVSGGTIGSSIDFGGCTARQQHVLAVSPVDGTAYALLFDCSGTRGVTVARGSNVASTVALPVVPAFVPTAFDGAAHLYVSGAEAGTSVYATPMGNVAPPLLRTVSVVAGDIAIDSSGALYGVVSSGGASKINVYPPNATGIAAPIRMLQPPAGGAFFALALDRSDNIYVSGTLNAAPAVFVYPARASGPAIPSRVITGSATLLTAQAPIAADASGNTYVAVPDAILVFSPAANGNAPPSATASSLQNPPGWLAIDNAGASPPPPPSGNPAPAAHTQVIATLPYVSGMTAGPDTALWFADGRGHVYRVGATNDPGGAGNVTTYNVPGDPTDITTGADGALWIAEQGANAILRLTTGGSFTQYPLPLPSQRPVTIGRGGDGNVWFFTSDHHIGRITPAGAISEYSFPVTESQGPNIIAAPDGNTYTVLDISATQGGDLTRIAPDGTLTSIATLPGAGPLSLGSDGNLWVAMNVYGANSLRAANAVARIPFAGGSASVFPVYLPPSAVVSVGIAPGPLGNMYAGMGGIEALSTSGVQQFDVAQPTQNQVGTSHPNLVSGPDGNLWYYQLFSDTVSTRLTVLTP